MLKYTLALCLAPLACLASISEHSEYVIAFNNDNQDALERLVSLYAAGESTPDHDLHVTGVVCKDDNTPFSGIITANIKHHQVADMEAQLDGVST